MSECKQFNVKLAYSDEPEDEKEAGGAEVTYAFSYEGRLRNNGVIFTIKSGHLSASIHTNEQSLLAMAMKIIKEMG